MSLKVYILPTLKLTFFSSSVEYCSISMLIVTNVPANSAAL